MAFCGILWPVSVGASRGLFWRFYVHFIQCIQYFLVERATGIEPVSEAWEPSTTV
jgi:hypothetical protein